MANARYHHRIKSNKQHTGVIVLQVNGFEFADLASFHKHLDGLIVNNLHSFLLDVWRKPISDDIIETINDNHILGFYRTQLGVAVGSFYKLATEKGLPDPDSTFTYFVEFSISPKDHFDDLLVRYGTIGLNQQKIINGTLYHADAEGIEHSMDEHANYYECVPTPEGLDVELRLISSIPVNELVSFN